MGAWIRKDEAATIGVREQQSNWQINNSIYMVLDEKKKTTIPHRSFGKAMPQHQMNAKIVIYIVLNHRFGAFECNRWESDVEKRTA